MKRKRRDRAEEDKSEKRIEKSRRRKRKESRKRNRLVGGMRQGYEVEKEP